MGLEDNPLEDIDLDLLSTGGSGSPFDVRGGEEDDSTKAPVIPVKGDEDDDSDDDKEGDDDSLEFIDDYKGIGVRGEEGDEDDDSLSTGSNEDDDTNAFWSTLGEAGIIEIEEGELEDEEVTKDMEWFAEKATAKVEKGIKEGIDEYKESLPEDLKFLIDNYEKGVSLTDLAKAEAGIMEYASIEEEALEENIDLQKRMVRDILKLQGESDSDIEELVADYEDSGLLEKNAKRAQKKLINHQKESAKQLIEQQQKAAQERARQYEEWTTNLKKTIDSKEEIIPGLKLNDKQKKALYSGITKVDKDNKNEVMRFREANPEFDLVVAYMATVLKTKDNKIDWSKLTEVAETKATRTLKNKAKDSSKTGTNSRGRSLSDVNINIMKNAIK